MREMSQALPSRGSSLDSGKKHFPQVSPGGNGSSGTQFELMEDHFVFSGETA